MPAGTTKCIAGLEALLNAEAAEGDSTWDEDANLHGLSKTLRILVGRTRRPPRPEKVSLAVRILLGLSMVEGNSVPLAKSQALGVLQHFLINYKPLQPDMADTAIRVLINLAALPENHVRLTTSCLNGISSVLSTMEDPQVVFSAIQFLLSVSPSYEAQLQTCDQSAILSFFVESLGNKKTKEDILNKILQLIFTFAPSATQGKHGGLSLIEMSAMTILPSKKRMDLCSLGALESFALGLGVDPYQLNRESLIEALLKFRYPPVPSKIFETPGLIDSLLSILFRESAEINKIFVCKILSSYTLVPDNRLELIYGPQEAAKRIIGYIGDMLLPASEFLAAYKKGPSDTPTDADESKAKDPSAHIRAAFSKRFETVYEAWVYYDKVGNWIVTTADFDAMTTSLSLGIPVLEILQLLDPRGTRFLDPHDFCAVVSWHELPTQNSKVEIARMLKEAQSRRKQILSTAAARTKAFTSVQVRAVPAIARRFAASSSKKISQRSMKGNAASWTIAKSKRLLVSDDSKGQPSGPDHDDDVIVGDNADTNQTAPSRAEIWQMEYRQKIVGYLNGLHKACKLRLQLLLSTLYNASSEIACHDVFVLEYYILERIEPCLFLEPDEFGIRDAAQQLWTRLEYILDENSLILSEEQQRRIQQSVGKWQNAGLNAIFNTWKHVLVLLRVHQISIPTSYRNACYELQVPSSAATAGTALRTFLTDPNSNSLTATNAGLSVHSAQALGCALRSISLDGSKLRALNIVQLRKFERLAPLKTIDISNNNIRDEGLAFLVSAIIAIEAAITSLNVSFNNLGETAGEQVAGLIDSGHLEELKISGNKLGGKGILSIAKVLENNSRMLALDISRNVGNAPAGSALGEMLVSNSSLKFLDCSWNEISAENCDAFFSGVAQNMSLSELNASWNTRGKNSIVSIGTAIRDCNIEVLDLSHLGLDTKDAVVMADNIRDACCLQELILSGNPIGPGGCRMILRAANTCTHVEDADSGFAINVALENCGAVDSYVFNPAEPAGKYVLDLSDPASHSIVQDLAFIASQKKGAFVTGSMKLGDEIFTLPTSTVGGRVALPKEGLLHFRYISTQRSVSALDILNKSGFKRFKHSISNVALRPDALNEIVDLHVGSDTFFDVEMVKELLEIHNLPSPTRTHLVITAFHRMVGAEAGREVLALLTADERAKAEAAFGHLSMEFCPRNPTGFYRLQLSDHVQRCIAMQLQRLTQDQSDLMNKKMQYYEKRTKGGVREDLPSIWRNLKVNGASFTWTAEWRLPTTSTIEFDFVWLPKPTETDSPISLEEFEKLIHELKGMQHGVDRLRHIRDVATETFFTTKQIIAFLQLLDVKMHRVDLLVTTFSRTFDFHGLTHLYNDWISPSERSMLVYRIGVSNIFDEVMAVGYYELNLTNAEERFIAQELLQLACNEPGDNQIDTQYEGCDFQIPAPWIQDVPRKGLLQLFYCRESQIVKKVFTQGAFDHNKNPVWVGTHAISDLCPEWLKPFCEPGTNQAAGTEWVQSAKLRLIKAKMHDKFGTAKECFSHIDKGVDKDGTVSRVEWSAGLFAIGVWLHPNETKALFQVLDADGSGTIDLREFEEFWSTY